MVEKFAIQWIVLSDLRTNGPWSCAAENRKSIQELSWLPWGLHFQNVLNERFNHALLSHHNDINQVTLLL